MNADGPTSGRAGFRPTTQHRHRQTAESTVQKFALPALIAMVVGSMIGSGIFAYAKYGFGEYWGFAAAVGFWIGTCVGNTLTAVIVASILVWAFHFFILRGVQGAAGINKIVTIAKIVPLLLFVVVLLFNFDAQTFADNLWGGPETEKTFGSIWTQVRQTMLVTVLSFGVLPREEIAAMRAPSVAGVMESMVGPWGARFISVGLIVSVLGAYLAWSLLAAEVPYLAAKYGLFPKYFEKTNEAKVPVNSLLLTNLVVQGFLIVTMFTEYAFRLSLELTSALTLIPYLLVCAYAFKLAATGETYDNEPVGADLPAGHAAVLARPQGRRQAGVHAERDDSVRPCRDRRRDCPVGARHRPDRGLTDIISRVGCAQRAADPSPDVLQWSNGND
jgi:arginine:ornithine antiporter/lysine permease